METPIEMSSPASTQNSPPKVLPLLPFHAPPHLLHMCAIDSLMPSPSRNLETGYESPIRSLEEQDFITPIIVASPKTPTGPISSLVSEKEIGSLPAFSSPIPPSQGAWKVPLFTASQQIPNPSKLSTPSVMASSFEDLASPTSWPSLLEGKQKSLPRRKGFVLTKSHPPVVSKPISFLPSEVSDEEKQRFPWASKMDPATRNLYRATSPTYLEDGTPQVIIPNHVLLQGLENQNEYVLGQFHQCIIPSGGLVHAVVNRIWGRKCRIFSQKAGICSYLFHIPDESTRTWVLQRGLWHVDDCLMFVAPWTPTTTLSMPQITTIPVWVTLKNIPITLYSIPGISHIASGLGAPMLTHKPRLDPMLMGEAKILVEVELARTFPQKVAAKDEMGSVHIVDVEYTWLPTKCGRCGNLGHKDARCLQPNSKDQASKPTTSTTAGNKTKVSAPMYDSVVAKVIASDEISKGVSGAASDRDVVTTTAEFVADPVATSVTTLEAATAVVTIDVVPSEAQIASAPEVFTTITNDSTTTTNEASASFKDNTTTDTNFTQLAVTNEAAPMENKGITFTEVVSTSQHFSSPSGNILRSSKAFEFGATNGINQFGMPHSSDGYSSDSDSLYENSSVLTSKRGRLVKPSQKSKRWNGQLSKEEGETEAEEVVEEEVVEVVANHTPISISLAAMFIL